MIGYAVFLLIIDTSRFQIFKNKIEILFRSAQAGILGSPKTGDLACFEGMPEQGPATCLFLRQPLFI